MDNIVLCSHTLLVELRDRALFTCGPIHLWEVGKGGCKLDARATGASWSSQRLVAVTSEPSIASLKGCWLALGAAVSDVIR